MNITRQQLETMLRDNKGATIVTLMATTDARAKQGTKNSPSPYRGQTVVKHARVNGMIGWIYANSVNNQRAREGHTEFFESQPRKWGERVVGTPLVEYKDSVYLELKVQSVLDAEYSVNGIVLDAEQFAHLKPYLPVRKQAATQETDKAILVADYNLDNIRSIRMGGEAYTVV